MNWEKMLEIKCWTPLYSVFDNPEHFGEGLYRVGEFAFVLTKPFDQTLEDGPTGTKNITLLYWIDNIKNIERLVFQRSIDKYFKPKMNPPKELLLGGDGTYSSMKALCKHYPDSFLETATYTSPDGLFVHKCLEISRFEFCYLSNEIIHNEKTYGITVRLL